MMDKPGSAIGVEAASVEEFLRLLRDREGSADRPRGPRSVNPMAVFVSSLHDVTSGRYAFPKVVRHVLAAFTCGPNVVSYRRTTSNAIELPEVARKLAERQREACEQLRTEIERGLKKSGLRVPVREGFLRYPTDYRHTWGDDSG